jgi:hypothetical protein
MYRNYRKFLVVQENCFEASSLFARDSRHSSGARPSDYGRLEGKVVTKMLKRERWKICMYDDDASSFAKQMRFTRGELHVNTVMKLRVPVTGESYKTISFPKQLGNSIP